MIERVRKLWLIVLAAILLALYGAVNLSDAVHVWTTAPFQCPPPSAYAACVTLTDGSGPTAGLSFGIGVASLVLAGGLLVLFRRLERRR